jgi:HEAT repeat protein
VDRDSPRTTKLRDELAPWASVFHEEFVTLLSTSKDQPNLRAHVALILQAAGTPEVADGVLELLGTEGPELDALLVRTVGGMPKSGRAARERLTSIAESDVPPAVLREALLALVRTKAPRASEITRRVLEEATDPDLLAQAVTALSHASDVNRDDARTFRRLWGEKSTSQQVRVACLRALGEVEESVDSRRILHDLLADGTNVEELDAALDALKKVGSRESSKRPLAKFVETDHPLPLREKAARVLLDLGSNQGIRHLIDPLIRAADEDRRSYTRQREVGIACYVLGAYADAHEWFERAYRVANAARRYEPRAWQAKCYAQLGQFERAAKVMKDAGYTTFREFADDPAFAVMKKQARYRALFE